MRRYTVTVNNDEHVIDVKEVTADTFEVTVADRVVTVRLDAHADLAQAVIAPQIEVGSISPAAAPVVPTVSAPTSSRPPAAPRPQQSSGASNALTAPMPGVVLSIATQVGAQVSRGEAVMVLEAMKMKNSLYATRDGVVAEIAVTEGQQVSYGDVLLVFEAES